MRLSGSRSPVGLVYMFNLIVGTGALTMPKAFATAGWLVSLVLLVFLGCMSFVTTTFVVEAMAAANAQLRWKRMETHKEEEEDDSSTASDSDVLIQDSYERAEKQPILSVQRRGSPNLFEITDRVEMGQMASMFFNKVGVNLFYFCIIIYLYGDLAIYAAAVPFSLMQVTCATGNDSCGVEADTKYSDTDPCWGRLRRVDAYRIYLEAEWRPPGSLDIAKWYLVALAWPVARASFRMLCWNPYLLAHPCLRLERGVPSKYRLAFDQRSPRLLGAVRKLWHEHSWFSAEGRGVCKALLAVFTLLLGPFTFFDVQKTKYLQILTSLMRWIAPQLGHWLLGPLRAPLKTVWAPASDRGRPSEQAVFTLLLGPFTFFDVQKTKYLQILTSLMRWIASMCSEHWLQTLTSPGLKPEATAVLVEEPGQRGHFQSLEPLPTGILASPVRGGCGGQAAQPPLPLQAHALQHEDQALTAGTSAQRAAETCHGDCCATREVVGLVVDTDKARGPGGSWSAEQGVTTMCGLCSESAGVHGVDLQG
ncbi:Transmembrane protein 104 [Tupaia chinensis]|uniref:Transmembrane protein 104 n=1 Tax=Tupaia chinensis TaxID=246437 RepID=L9L0Q2_TUPCH|nr:Transmembrane protein 104 [Tupaia chinensis]